MFIPLNGPAVHGALSVTTTPQEVKVGASRLEERNVLTIQPLNGDVYFGYSDSVTSLTGTKIYQGQVFPLEATDELPVWIVAASGTIDVRITEVS
jgi:hypothetical protein